MRELSVLGFGAQGVGKESQLCSELAALLPLPGRGCSPVGKGVVGSPGSRAPLLLSSAPVPPSLINTCSSSGPQVLHLYCDTCSVPICRECTMGRHGGHSFIYLQEALQDSRALTIQLLADAQQGRQAIQVSLSPPFTSFPCSSLDRKHFLSHCLSDGMYRLLGGRQYVGAVEQ